ncbi:MAG: serine hydrolase domain-containing protein [Bacteroidota bacterium]
MLGIILGIPAYSQSNDSLKIAQTVETYVSTNDFSGTILVAKNGMPIYHQSFGYGYLPAKNAIVNDFHFSIASVTKLFTAIRVLQLVDVGKLSLDESIETYLPKFKIPQGSRITLHHLLMHNSGLPNEKDRVYRRPYSPEEIVHTSLKNKAKEDFGDFHYNNLDYILLGLVIEAVSGASWEEQIQTFILDKLGMQETGFLAYGSYPSRFAYTYSYRNTKKPVQDALFYIENFYAAGSMYSTSKDLLLLDQALYGQALLSEKMSDLLAKSYPENSYCGYSVWNYRYPFSDIKPLIMERRGGIMGANVVLVRMPEQSGSIIILSNDDRFNPDSFGDESNLRERLIRVLGG